MTLKQGSIDIDNEAIDVDDNKAIDVDNNKAIDVYDNEAIDISTRQNMLKNNAIPISRGT